MNAPTTCPTIDAVVVELGRHECIGTHHTVLAILGAHQVLVAHGWRVGRTTTLPRMRTVAHAEQRFHQVHT